MGLSQRVKGKVFERRVATLLRDAWPGALVVRASQAERAHNSDVFIMSGGGPLLESIWWECQDAINPTPELKLQQAERDTEGTLRIPIVVWHRKGSPSIYTSMRLRTAMGFTGNYQKAAPDGVLITMDFGSLMAVLDHGSTAGR